MQQEEIARLKKNTKKIREKAATAATEQPSHGQERGENLKTGEQDSIEQPKVRCLINSSEIWLPALVLGL